MPRVVCYPGCDIIFIRPTLSRSVSENISDNTASCRQLWPLCIQVLRPGLWHCEGWRWWLSESLCGDALDNVLRVGLCLAESDHMTRILVSDWLLILYQGCTISFLNPNPWNNLPIPRDVKYILNEALWPHDMINKLILHHWLNIRVGKRRLVSITRADIKTKCCENS